MPIEILMPALSPTMTEGNLVSWLKQEGDTVESGDVIAEIETDKAAMEVEAVDEGILGKILVPEGSEEVKVNTLIAVLLEEGEGQETLEAFQASVAGALSEVPQTPQASQASTTMGSNVLGEAPAGQEAPSSHTSEQRLFASPLARRLAHQEKIDLTRLEGSGPRGRLIKADVEAALSRGEASLAGSAATAATALASAAAPTASQRPGDGLFPAYRETKLSNMRKVIAKRLTEAKREVPHFYLTVDCALDALLEARRDLNQTLPDDRRLSVNDFVIKAVAQALKAVPDANVAYHGDGMMRSYEAADVAVAVAIEGGLVTPIIRDAQEKSLGTISSEMKALIKKAREGKLRPEEFQGGTFSLSNLGMYGIKHFSAVINPPQGCILAVGAGEKRPVVQKEGTLGSATVMTCTLSVDHRVVDGAVGADFLKHFKQNLEAPVLMIL